MGYMPRWTIVVAGTIGVAAVVGHVLFAPLPGSTAPTPEPSRPPAASAPITPIPETEVDGRGSSGPDQQGIDDHNPEGSDEPWPHDWPDPPDGAPSWWLPPLETVTAEDFSAIQTAEQVTAAFARPAPGSEAGWWPKVRPLMSGQGVADYESVDPQEVGHTTVTGSGQLVQVFTHTPIAGVDVPTDGGIYRVMLEPDDRKPTGWAVTSIRPVEAYA